MAEYINVINKKTLDALQNHEKGEIALCEEDHTYYFYDGEKWNAMPANMTENGIEINLYELNKQIIAQLPPFDEQRLQDAKDTFNNWKKRNGIYLLYGKEIGYFTLFMPKEEDEYDSFETVLFECLGDVSKELYSFDVVNENTIEIWLKYNDAPTVLYLFDYAEGIVPYHG